MNKSSQMGVWGLPGTFPTNIMLEYIMDNFPHLWKDEWTRQKVNDIYFAYKQGLQSGDYVPWGQGTGTQNADLVQYLANTSGHAEKDVRLWLMGLKTKVESGEIASEFLTQNAVSTTPGQTISTAIAKPFKSLGEFTEGTAKTVKWIGILAIIGIGLYFSWPVLKKIRKR